MLPPSEPPREGPLEAGAQVMFAGPGLVRVGRGSDLRGALWVKSQHFELSLEADWKQGHLCQKLSTSTNAVPTESLS